MSRSGYSDDCENLGLWRGAVNRAIAGKRGQAFLREMAAAMDAMPVKELAADVIVENGAACAIGTVALARNMDVSDLGDGSDQFAVADRFGIARALAAEIAYENDECEKCRLESGEIQWCSRCEDVATDEESGMCQPCWNANEQAGIDHEMDKFFGGGAR